MDERGISQWLWFEQIEEEGKTAALGSSGQAQAGGVDTKIEDASTTGRSTKSSA